MEEIHNNDFKNPVASFANAVNLKVKLGFCVLRRNYSRYEI